MAPATRRASIWRTLARRCALIAARACANTAEVVFDCNIGPIQVIQHFGTDAQRERYLRRAAAGEILRDRAQRSVSSSAASAS